MSDPFDNLLTGVQSLVVENTNPHVENEIVIHLKPGVRIDRIRLKWPGEQDQVFERQEMRG